MQGVGVRNDLPEKLGRIDHTKARRARSACRRARRPRSTATRSGGRSRSTSTSRRAPCWSGHRDRSGHLPWAGESQFHASSGRARSPGHARGGPARPAEPGVAAAARDRHRRWSGRRRSGCRDPSPPSWWSGWPACGGPTSPAAPPRPCAHDRRRLGRVDQRPHRGTRDVPSGRVAHALRRQSDGLGGQRGTRRPARASRRTAGRRRPAGRRRAPSGRPAAKVAPSRRRHGRGWDRLPEQDEGAEDEAGAGRDRETPAPGLLGELLADADACSTADVGPGAAVMLAREDRTVGRYVASLDALFSDVRGARRAGSAARAREPRLGRRPHRVPRHRHRRGSLPEGPERSPALDALDNTLGTLRTRPAHRYARARGGRRRHPLTRQGAAPGRRRLGGRRPARALADVGRVAHTGFVQLTDLTATAAEAADALPDPEAGDHAGSGGRGALDRRHAGRGRRAAAHHRRPHRREPAVHQRAGRTIPAPVPASGTRWSCLLLIAVLAGAAPPHRPPAPRARALPPAAGAGRRAARGVRTGRGRPRRRSPAGGCGPRPSSAWRSR